MFKGLYSSFKLIWWSKPRVNTGPKFVYIISAWAIFQSKAGTYNYQQQTLNELMSIISHVNYDTILLPSWLTYMLNQWVRDLILGLKKLPATFWLPKMIRNLYIK